MAKEYIEREALIARLHKVCVTDDVSVWEYKAELNTL